jgi:GNAT superfamily N-acetyltransferase
MVGSIFAFVTGLPIALFNGCVIVRPTTGVQVRAALAWVQDRGVPHQVSVAEELAPGLGRFVTGAGLRPDAVPYPAMVLHPVPAPPNPPPGVTVAVGMDPDLASYLPPSLGRDPDVRVFTARLGARPAGMSIAIRTGDVAGVYGVATRREFRLRGVGTASTWAAVAAGRAWGCDPIVLQATEMGRPTYERMGFRTVMRYITYSGDK